MYESVLFVISFVPVPQAFVGRPREHVMVVVILFGLPISAVSTKRPEGLCKNRRVWDLHRRGVQYCRWLGDRHGFSWPGESWLRKMECSFSGQVLGAALCSDFQCYSHRGFLMCLLAADDFCSS